MVDEVGLALWPKKIDNNETAILTALGEILDLADEVHWAVDISGTRPAPESLPSHALPTHQVEARFTPGRT